MTTLAARHDAYAADYDAQVRAYDCHIADLLFGLCYETTRPGQRLLDVGVGSRLSAQLFAKAGLEVHGMDFSLAMLEICRGKGFAADMQLHDITQTPWPYPTGGFEHLVCCGVFHFLADLDAIFAEARRVLAPGGVFAFTIRLPAGQPSAYEHQTAGGFDIFSHAPTHIEDLLTQNAFTWRKRQKCFVGEDIFLLWITQSTHASSIHLEKIS
jgi:predicted TPR repeat methyltransferase